MLHPPYGGWPGLAQGACKLGGMVKRIMRWVTAGQPRTMRGEAQDGTKASLTMWKLRTLTVFDMAKDRLEKSSDKL